MKILMLGCGFVGARVVLQLAARWPEVEFIIADRNLVSATTLADRIGSRAAAVGLDINDSKSLKAVMEKVDLVFNAIGPFHKTALPTINAAIEAGVDYMDINDDHDIAAKLVFDESFHRRAMEVGSKILIGCGNTPGFSNVLARFGANRLDKIHKIRLCWLTPFAPQLFSPSVWDHLYHILDGEVTQYLDGRYQKVPAYGGKREISFLAPFGTYYAYHSGHGEAVTIPRFIPVTEEVSVSSCFFPEAGDQRMQELVRFGFGGREILPELGISPLQFFLHYAASEQGAKHLTVDLQNEPQGYGIQVEIEGDRGADRVRLILETHGFYAEALKQIAAGADPFEVVVDPTPTCARLMVEAMLRGEIDGCGLLAPEACIDPEPYVRAVIRDTGIALHEREEILRKHRFA